MGAAAAGRRAVRSRAASPTDTDDLLGDDPFTGWESAADDALSAFAEDDALVRTVHLSRGPTPATEYILEMTADLTVHAWDLARATDGDTELDGELVTAALVFAEQLPEDGIPGVIDPPLDVSASAPPQTRLLARFGRKGLTPAAIGRRWAGDRPGLDVDEAVFDVVERIPPGRVSTYGAIGRLVGIGPRRVARALSSGGGAVPWYRVVRADGSAAEPVRVRAAGAARRRGRADAQRPRRCWPPWAGPTDGVLPGCVRSAPCGPVRAHSPSVPGRSCRPPGHEHHRRAGRWPRPGSSRRRRPWTTRRRGRCSRSPAG